MGGPSPASFLARFLKRSRGAAITPRSSGPMSWRRGSRASGREEWRQDPMQLWFHNENTYPFVSQKILDAAESVRGSLPGRLCDPKIAADLFHECLDESLLCDDLGINIVSIEHHAGINSLYGASPIVLGALARQPGNGRILP